jgi:DNA-binding NarL/FixJ family response regulator
MSAVRVLLIAQSPVLRYGIRGTLESVVTLDDVVEASGALEAAALLNEASPALIVIHDALPGVTANVTAKMLQELRPGSTIAILSDHVGEGHLAAAERHGATALISLADAPIDFAATIEHLLLRPRRRGTDRLISSARVAGLTAPEIAALDGLVRGLPARSTAALLRISDAALNQHVASVIAKLSVGDQAAAVVAAVRLGLVNLTDQLPAPHLSHDLGDASTA